MLHFGLGRRHGHKEDDRHVAQRARPGVREPCRRPALHRDRAPGAGAAAPGPRPPVPQFEDATEACGLSLRSREDAVDESALQPLMPLRLNRRGPALAVGDVEGAGRDDVVVGGTTLDPLRVMAATAPGRFERGAGAPGAPPPSTTGRSSSSTPREAGSRTCWSPGGATPFPAGAPEYQPRLFLNDGRGGLSPAPAGALPELSIDAGAVAAADFDHSGQARAVHRGARPAPASIPRRPAARSWPTAAAGSRTSPTHSRPACARSAW
jgi:hypothetical protein